MLFNTLLKNNVSRLIDSFVFEKITILHEGKIGKDLWKYFWLHCEGSGLREGTAVVCRSSLPQLPIEHGRSNVEWITTSSGNEDARPDPTAHYGFAGNSTFVDSGKITSPPLPNVSKTFAGTNFAKEASRKGRGNNLDRLISRKLVLFANHLDEK